MLNSYLNYPSSDQERCLTLWGKGKKARGRKKYLVWAHMCSKIEYSYYIENTQKDTQEIKQSIVIFKKF